MKRYEFSCIVFTAFSLDTSSEPITIKFGKKLELKIHAKKKIKNGNY